MSWLKQPVPHDNANSGTHPRGFVGAAASLPLQRTEGVGSNALQTRPVTNLQQTSRREQRAAFLSWPQRSPPGARADSSQQYGRSVNGVWQRPPVASFRGPNADINESDARIGNAIHAAGAVGMGDTVATGRDNEGFGRRPRSFTTGSVNDYTEFDNDFTIAERLEMLREEYAVHARIAAEAQASARRAAKLQAAIAESDMRPSPEMSRTSDGDSVMDEAEAERPGDEPSSDLQAPPPHFEQPPQQALTSAYQPSRPTPDVTEVAKWLSSMKMVCVHCNSTNTPQWRKGWYSAELGRPVTLCNACGLKFNKKCFCPICNVLLVGKQVDRQTQVAGCSHCRRHVHVECEEKLTGVAPIPLKSLSTRSRTSKGYFCPDCRAARAVISPP